jgi:hypothetical protein
VGQGLDARIPATLEAVALAVARAALEAAATNQNSIALHTILDCRLQRREPVFVE